jgi:hypothetical protein
VQVGVGIGGRAVEHAVDETDRFVVAVAAGQVQGFVDDHTPGHVRTVAQFRQAHDQDHPLQDAEAVGAPAGADQAGQPGLQVAAVRRDLGRQVAGEHVGVVGRFPSRELVGQGVLQPRAADGRRVARLQHDLTALPALAQGYAPVKDRDPVRVKGR